MIRPLTFEVITHNVIPCILNNLITLLIMYKFMKTFLGYRPEHKRTSIILYALFFVLETFLNFSKDLLVVFIIPYSIEKYFYFALYLTLLIIVILIALCYKPTFSTGVSSGLLTALFLYCSVPMANYIFNELYRFVVPNHQIYNSSAQFRHILYVIFEEYQQVFIYVLQITIKLLFLFVVLRVKHIYDERNMYYMQASRQGENNLELKQFRHDLKNHMGALNEMLSTNNIDNALAYLTTISDIGDSTQLFSRTGNVALDSIINFKLSKAVKNEIECTFNAVIPENLSVRDEDIIIILGNLLDNSIEACLKLESDRYIKVQLTYQRGLFIISIANSFDGSIKKSGKKLATLKSDISSHGLGLSNVEKVLSHYNGTLDFSAIDTEFSISVVMYIDRD